MKTADFDFHLPESHIARHPTKERSQSRLLCLNRITGERQHKIFHNLVDLLEPQDLLVMNNSKVIPARIYGQKDSGGKVEILIERILSSHSARAHIRGAKGLTPGRRLFLGDNKTPFTLLQKIDDLYDIRKENQEDSLLAWCHQYGHIPLPPYMQRDEEAEDLERYQTVYATNEGSVAAPTAGLHFDQNLLDAIKAKGIAIANVTLHVGSGTFQPVRVDNIQDHTMHHEWFSIPEETCEAIAACKARQGRVVAVGTTTVRTLESAARETLKASARETNIFIYPGFKFQVVDALITNFHLPKSTLLMLVSAFASKESIINAYEEAIRENYRFFSYGDAMFIS